MMKYGIIAALLFAALVAVADANAEDGAGLGLNLLERFNVRLEYEQCDFDGRRLEGSLAHGRFPLLIALQGRMSLSDDVGVSPTFGRDGFRQ